MRPDVSRSAPAPTCSVQNFLVGSSIGGVAAAGGSLETAAVQYLDITTMIFYESVTLQHACGGGDADAAYTEHVGEEFVGDVKTVAMSSILRHEQPTRQAAPAPCANACSRAAAMPNANWVPNIPSRPTIPTSKTGLPL